MIQVVNTYDGLRNINSETITDRRQENYFRDLKEMLAYTVELGKLTALFFSADAPDKYILTEMRALEFRNNDLSLRVLFKLYKYRITPFDSLEMKAFVNSVIKISEALLNAAERVDLYGMKNRIKFANQLMDILISQLNLLNNMVNNLSDKRTGDCIGIHELASKADKIYELAIRHLHSNETISGEIIKQKDILDLLVKASDQCEMTSDIIVMGFYKFL